MPVEAPETLFETFYQSLLGPDRLERLAEGVIGEGLEIEGPFGPRKLVYADYVASGRAMRQVETFVQEHVLPHYANSHTEASFCGSYMTRMREAARALISRHCNAGPEYATIFAGSGATSGLNRLVHLFGISAEIAEGRKPLVLIGPYEHHSNILPWRESGAEVVEIGEADNGGPDLKELARILETTEPGRLKIGAFSMMSNVTGIVTDADAVTRVLKANGALSVWDCAGSGPYLPINMTGSDGAAKDAVVLSTHKFPGGPGASGVLIVRRAAVRAERPSLPGGGTVRFVSPWHHDYTGSLCAREEAGTPNVIGDIRAALCFLVKRAIGRDLMDERHAALRQKAVSVWATTPNLHLLGNMSADRCLPVFSFRVRDPNGGYIHQQLVTRMLSDVFGIQARGGCACAGPYAHRLLGLDRQASEALMNRIMAGDEIEKPGWTRLNLSVLMSDDKVDRIIKAVATLAREHASWRDAYDCDPLTARFKARTIAA